QFFHAGILRLGGRLNKDDQNRPCQHCGGSPAEFLFGTVHFLDLWVPCCRSIVTESLIETQVTNESFGRVRKLCFVKNCEVGSCMGEGKSVRVWRAGAKRVNFVV